MTTKIGREGEEIALNYLLEKGLTFLGKNFKTKHGEIDLIMKDEEKLTFVEVKYRRGEKKHGAALEAIDDVKKQRLYETAIEYMKRKKYAEDTDCVFSAVLIDEFKGKRKINFIKDIFI